MKSELTTEDKLRKLNDEIRNRYIMLIFFFVAFVISNLVMLLVFHEEDLRKDSCTKWCDANTIQESRDIYMDCLGKCK